MIVIDLVLAGDNAVVIGMAAAGLPHELRRKAVVIGIAAAAVLRIIFALFTTRLLDFSVGLVVAGGLLLLWVAWKLFRETRRTYEEMRLSAARPSAVDCAPGGRHLDGPAFADAAMARRSASLVGGKRFPAALLQIVAADVSMSLDNVLAVAGTARRHPVVLAIGLTLSVALTGVAATVIAGVLRRHLWISYLGILLIAWVAATMIIGGTMQLLASSDLMPRL